MNSRTKLIDFAEGDLKEWNGRRNHGTNTIDYPDAQHAQREAGGFPPGLRFRTKSELLDDLNRRIALPEQTKTLGGVRVTLYGVIVFPNLPDGIGVEAVVKGNAERNCGPGHPVQIVNAPLFPSKRSDLSQVYHDLSHAKFTHIRGFNHHLFVGSESDDLLTRAPRKLTLRVPVWRTNSSAGSVDGVPGTTGSFIGYVTFTTSKLFFNVGAGYLPNYGDPQPAN